MAWIVSCQELRDHPKTSRLVRALRVSRAQVIGHLHMLWWWALDQADDGDLTGLTNEEIAEAAGWEDNPDTFVSSLIGCGINGGPGFIEETDGCLLLHDWWEYAGKLVDQRRKNAEKQKKWRDEHKRNGYITATSPLRNQATQHNTTQQNIDTHVTAKPQNGKIVSLSEKESAKLDASASTSKKPKNPSSESKPRANRENALALWSAYYPNGSGPNTDKGRSTFMPAFCEMDLQGIQPAEIPRLMQEYREQHPTWELTPHALAKWAHKLPSRTKRQGDPTRDEQGRDRAFWAQWQEMTREEQVEHTDAYRATCADDLAREEFFRWQKLYPIKPAPT